MILLHVTRRERTHSIDRRGVSPAYSEGRMPVSWFVEQVMAEWAILHVQQRHGIPLGDVVIYTVKIPQEEWKPGRFRRWCRAGVWNSPEVTPPEWLVERSGGLDWEYGLTEAEREAFAQEEENLSGARG